MLDYQKAPVLDVPPETPPTWAVVSLMGHKTYAGRLSEEEKFSAKLGRLDIPEDDGTFRTIYFGGQSVYSIQVVTEAVARTVARSHDANPAPVSPRDFPKQLAAAEGVPICPDCGKDEEDCDCHAAVGRLEDEDDYRHGDAE